MKTVVVDSSVFISHFGKNERYTKESNIFFSKLQNSPVTILLPMLAVAETLVTLVRYGFKNISEVSDILAHFEQIALDEAIMTYLTDMLHKETINLKTSDMIIAVTAKRSHATLVTWDKQLLKQSIVPALTPSQWVTSLSS